MDDSDGNKEVNDHSVKEKWYKFHLLPSGEPQVIANKGLRISLFGIILGLVMQPVIKDKSLIGVTIELCSGMMFWYGGLLVLSASFIWIKNKIQKAKITKNKKNN